MAERLARAELVQGLMLTTHDTDRQSELNAKLAKKMNQPSD